MLFVLSEPVILFAYIIIGVARGARRTVYHNYWGIPPSPLFFLNIGERIPQAPSFLMLSIIGGDPQAPCTCARRTEVRGTALRRASCGGAV